VSKEWLVLLLAASPISELRGAIPAGVAMGLPFAKVLMLSIIGNLLPVPILLFLLNPLADWARKKVPFLHRFFEWFFERTRKKAALVEKYEALGLILFVAIPLPITGAWTGCAAATLFKVRRRYALISIALGVLIAATIVSCITMLWFT